MSKGNLAEMEGHEGSWLIVLIVSRDKLGKLSIAKN
jgi:hypothetical protein